MIKYLPVQNEDGAIEAWSFINDRNETRIILKDEDIKSLCTAAFIANNPDTKLSKDCEHSINNYENNTVIRLTLDEIDELSKILLKIVSAGNYAHPFHSVQS